MAVATARRYARSNPRRVTGIISVVGYAVVIAAFAGLIPLPEIGAPAVQALSHAIAAVNTVALGLLLYGWRAIRRGNVSRHRTAMLGSFALIMLFLVLYITKIGGGFEKSFVGPTLVTYAYWAMLVVHIFLSVVAVPVVLHAVVLGLTHDPAELGDTSHPKVGRIAVFAWSISLALGVVTYVLLNHVYAWEKVHRGAFMLFALAPRLRDR